MRVISIDPSLARCGIAAIDFGARKVVDWKAIRTEPDPTIGRKTDDIVRRLAIVSKEVTAFIAANRGSIAIEGQVGASFGKASMVNVGRLMAAYGACIGSLGGRMPIVLMPSIIKERCTGHRDASKAEVWQAMQRHFTSFPPLPKSKPDQEAVQDAVSVGLAALPDLERIRDLAG